MGSVSSIRKRKSTVGGSAYKENASEGFFGVFHSKRKVLLEHVAGSAEREREYALKTIALHQITMEFIEEMKNEINILRNLDHPHIVRAYEVFDDGQQIFIVMELCGGGDLYARAPYSEKAAAKIVGNLLSAISYMHDKNIVHRDLKFENIMFESKAENAEVKIIDFGLSKKYAPGSYMTEGKGEVTPSCLVLS